MPHAVVEVARDLGTDGYVEWHRIGGSERFYAIVPRSRVDSPLSADFREQRAERSDFEFSLVPSCGLSVWHGGVPTSTTGMV